MAKKERLKVGSGQPFLSKAERDAILNGLPEPSEVESGWLIEFGSPPMYLAGKPDLEAWTTCSHCALRFSRKEDADKIADIVRPTLAPHVADDMRVCEHAWQ